MSRAVYYLLYFSIIMGCASTSNDIIAPPFLEPPINPFPPLVDETASEAESKDAAVEIAKPAPQLEKMIEEKKDPQTEWWAKYNQARIWIDSEPEMSCFYFMQLAREAKFPLTDLAEIRARQICGPNSVEPLTYDYRKFKNKPWLWPMAVEVALVEAINEDNKNELAQLYFEKSRLIAVHNEKVEYTEKAIAMAQQSGNQKYRKQLIKRLYALAPRKVPNPRADQLIKVAHDFKRARDFKKALAIYKQVEQSKKSSLDDRYLALMGLKSTYKLSEDKEQFRRTSESIVRFCREIYFNKKIKGAQKEKFAKRLYESHVALARAYWTEGMVKNAITTLQKAEAELKGKISLNEVYWLLGRIEDEKRNYQEAELWYQKAESECKDTCLLKEKILWNSAWNETKLQHHQKAVEIFDRFYSVTENPFAKPKIAFWKGKALQAMNEPKKAEEVFKQLTQDDPTGYYGMLSYRELKTALPIPAKYVSGPVSESLKLQDGFSLTEQGKYANWLISVEEFAVAGEYLDTHFEKIKKEKLDDINFIVDYLNAYARSNNYLNLFARLGELPNNTRNSVLSINPSMAFPQPYTLEVKEAANKFGVSAEFIYAIMRQESAFNPNARSPADAFGLMQLLPRMAKVASKTAGVNFTKDADLYRPHINIPLGAAFIKSLWQRYQGQFVLVAASYNASEKAIRSWINTRFFNDPLHFIEDIPYEETQNYIKLVLRNFIYYSSLNSQEKGIVFPEWALANLSEFRVVPKSSLERDLAGEKGQLKKTVDVQ